ncbi:fatty acid desaturase family protein [Chitinophaga pinensis]|uniref:Fatty acid desaturase n=1 Tax=Chitinophaga pinensis (strain ATCC 43595 / DSM 2588 / LMG 13176 / NBRC 15968 / NCIMB 11800 / UQM 2034) TaxID=485918 RepID=A0A979G8X8_CHIPD|nr:fatty acid desaturase [Chitinophaga pinensis]ACU63099.1 fatty acid desaturase [Chitinophaga pinensis DSM 2588]
MRDKHLRIAKDSELLQSIYRQVEEQLVIDKRKTFWKIFTKFICYCSLSVFLYSLLYTVESPAVFITCFILYGFLSLLFAFNFSHDFSHNTVFNNKKLNHLCFIFIYAIVGAHAEAWKQRHVNSHHYAPNVEDYDSDLRISKLIRVIPDSKHYWFHQYQHIYAPLAYTTYSLFWVFIKDFVILYSKDEYEARKGFRYHLSFWLQKIFYISVILILPLLFSQQRGYVVLAGFLLMHLSQSLFLLFTFFMTHHVEATAYPTTDENGYINTSWIMNQIRSSNDMHPFSETANFILGGFNNHIAHHLFPHIHHVHYPQLNRILYNILLVNHITPNQTSYWGGIRSHLRLLKRMSYPNNA